MNIFAGKTALVTGATSGIGLAIAKALLENGTKTYVVGRNFDNARLELNKFSECQFIPADLKNENDLKKLITELSHENLDILIHCAAAFSLGDLETEKEEDFDYLYQTNVKAPFILTKGLLPKLKHTQGDIIFINSTVGLDAKEKLSLYASSKHALKGMADGLRSEVLKDNVRVASVFCGSVDTDMKKTAAKLSGVNYDPSIFMKPEDVAEAILDILKLSRRATITDITIKHINSTKSIHSASTPEIPTRDLRINQK